MLPLPALSTLQRTALLILLGVLLLSAVALGGYLYGTGKAAEKAAERERTLLTQLNEANDKNREQEKSHDKRVADLRAEFAQQQADARARDERTIADLRSGNQRLRLQVSSCGAARSGAAESAPGGADGAGTAELAPETSAALWGIAADGDRAIRKLTALQAWARSAVQLCTIPQPENQQ